MSAGPNVRARVIVVDDDRLIREMVKDAIGDRASVECCDSSESALEALHREPADLIVSDLTMPGLSGIELLGFEKQVGYLSYGRTNRYTRRISCARFTWITTPRRRSTRPWRRRCALSSMNASGTRPAPIPSALGNGRASKRRSPEGSDDASSHWLGVALICERINVMMHRLTPPSQTKPGDRLQVCPQRKRRGTDLKSVPRSS